MLEWFGRYNQRQRDLAAGVDADLVRRNRGKFKLAGLLVALGSLLAGIERFIKLHGAIQEIGMWLSGLLLFGGVFLGYWAQRERVFLAKSDPKKPPSLFK